MYKSKDSVAILVSIIIIVVSFGLFNNHLKHKVAYANTQDDVARVEASPTPTPQNKVEVKPSLTPAPSNPINDEIRKVFGKHADDAFLLLSCENASHNPNAVNHNTDDVQSTDYGVFQINDYWQGIRHDGKAKQFLTDPMINIQIAWRIYEDDGYSFKLWTCGRKLGI